MTSTNRQLKELRALGTFDWHREDGDDQAATVARTFAAYAPQIAARHARRLQEALSAFQGEWSITLTTNDRPGDFGFRPI